MTVQVDTDVAIIGGGPAGMAAALSLITAGHRVKILERAPEARPAGNILNLWPPAIHALASMGVDTAQLGAPCLTTFRSASGRVRATVNLPQKVIDQYEGGFIGLLRPDLYRRMLAAMPAGTIDFNRQVDTITETGGRVEIKLSDGSTVTAWVVIGADGINSTVRTSLWGPSAKRNHDLHIIGGFSFAPVPGLLPNECVLSHNRYVQGTYSTILSEGRTGHQWWVLEAWPDAKPAPEDLKARALELARGFASPLGSLIAATEPDAFQRWPIRDRVPLTKWSKGRVTLAGDAAHATSPYAAYGAGMSICDGYFLGQRLHGVDLRDTPAVVRALGEYEALRVAHTTEQVQGAYFLGRLFHHVPFPLTYVRDAVLDHTGFMQRRVGEKNPTEIAEQLDVMGKGITEA
jgi:2-polyprenyl-6-methoxyphenol hydroxylase-like FAD-dependent oxidoreductase